MANEIIDLSSTAAEIQMPAVAGVAGHPSAAHKLEALAQARLQSTGYIALKHLTCEYHEGVLTLRGRVPSFFLRQVAQSTLRQLPGVEIVVDRLEVGAAAREDSENAAPHRRGS